MTNQVLLDRHDRIGIITLNRPEVRNAVNQALADDLMSAVETLEEDDSVSVLVLTGAGGTFCAGMDLKAFADGGPVATRRGFAGITEQPPSKPVIAAVEGWALAGGFEVALSCDLIVAARDARLGIPEVKRGLVAAAGGLLRLPRTLPYQAAMELALTGDPITAERAHQLGLVNVLSEPAKALDEALLLGGRIAVNSPLALRATKAVLSSTTGWTDPAVFAAQEEHVAMAINSEDAREGARAFTEKRVPVWKGR